MVKKSSKAKAGLARVPRRCAATAASKMKLMSDVEDGSLEDVCTRSNDGRKKALRFACTTAKKMASDSEGDVSCEVPNEQNASDAKPPEADSERSTKSINRSLNEDSDSEGVSDSEQKGRPTRHADNRKTRAAPSRTKNSLINFYW